uniref:non-specific serine/threonine protein kinase n=1 Tax=Kalanchoe fedtschenkoi TaxID=63787 RepID=A0A7N1A7N0_KALFE
MKTSYIIILFLIMQCNYMAVVECLLRTSMMRKASGNETDLAALLALKAGLVGGSPESVEALSSWNDSIHFCNWVGVTCEGRRHRRVTVLDLSDYNTGGVISPFIGNLSFLRVINLSGNRLEGFIPKEIGLLSRLEVFNVSNNALQGPFPLQLTNCSRLLTLVLYSNELTERIPDQLGSMPKLKSLNIGRNNFTGEIPASLGNISSLLALKLADIRLRGRIPTNLGKLKNLAYLHICGNNLSGNIPSHFYNLTSLRTLAIVDNHLSGTVASSMGLHFPHLRVAFLGMNSFTGIIPPTILNISRLQKFDVITNNFYGSVPKGLGRLKYLKLFALANNNLGSESEGDLDFLTNVTSNLKVLTIQKNRFGGMIPYSIGNLSSKIEHLYLGSNKISGHIPVGIGNLTSLVGLGLEYNKLSGEIPSSIGNLVMLQKLTLGGNRLQGSIPSSLGKLKNLFNLGWEENQLEGSIPLNLQFCSGLKEFYLSNNELNGTVSEKLISSLDQLTRLYLDGNYFTGYFPTSVGKLTNLNALDVSYNKFSGEIPTQLGKCSSLESLKVQANSFEGRIPSSLGALKAVQYLDFSGNNLSGGIPSELQDLHRLQILNISFNQLEGEVPTKGAFTNVTGFFIEGNEKLCGGIPALHLPNCSVTREKRRGMSNLVIVMMSVSIFFGLVLAAILTWVVCRKGTKRNDDAMVISPVGGAQYLRVSYKQLWDATDGFSVANLIGAGSFGSVFSGVLGDKPIAVKVMNLGKCGAIKSFKAECKVLSKIRHRNLLQILSCCMSLDFKGSDFMALVYELMPNGSLDSWLHGSRILNLSQRLDIIVDIASALEYLHHECEPQIVHCDLKPSNVLLDGDMVAHVGDFGLARILPGRLSDNLSQKQSMSSLGIKGTVGYVPPEYGMGGSVSMQGDTYSFGILLLEMVIRKRPTDEIFKGDTSLHSLCKCRAANSNLFDIVDSHLLADLNIRSENYRTNQEDVNVQKVQDCLAAIMEVGVACSVDSPNERMDIKEACKVLHSTRIKFLERTNVGARRQSVHPLPDEECPLSSSA